jgi:hypothetical protein
MVLLSLAHSKITSMLMLLFMINSVSASTYKMHYFEDSFKRNDHLADYLFGMFESLNENS